MKSTNIIVAGVGGQGSILASHIIADASIRYADRLQIRCNVRVGETFGAAMRGGAVASHVRVGEKVYGPLVGEHRADLILALEPLEALRVGAKYLAADGYAIISHTTLPPVDVKIGAAAYPDVALIRSALQTLGKKAVLLNGTELALEAGSARAVSVVMLGAAFASGILPCDEEALLQTLADRIPPKLQAINAKAFRLGMAAYRSAV